LFYKIKEKISTFSNVPVPHVISDPDVETIYEIPLVLEKEQVHLKICNVLNLTKKVKELDLKEWKKYVEKIKNPKHTIKVGMAGKYTRLRDSYASILKALEHAGTINNCKVDVEWVETTELKGDNVKKRLEGMDGIIVPGGFGSRGVEGKINCIKYVRENKIPFLGLCYGLQLAVVEYARHACGLDKAHEILNWKPSTPLEEGLKTFRRIEENLERRI